jgi:hypothetical protein
MDELQRIAVLENEVEARLLEEELDQRGIPHVMRSYYDQAYDGLFQWQRGWGEVQATAESREEILTILHDLRQGDTNRS